MLIEFQCPMLLLSTTFLLVSTSGLVSLLRVFVPRFRYGWLLAVGGSVAALASVFLWLPYLPISANLPLWNGLSSGNSFARFAALGRTWPYAVGIISLAMTAMLTSPARAHFPAPSTWALSLGIGALGLLAVTAENALTLVLIWAALDLVGAGVVLARTEDRSANAQLPVAFGLRLAAMGLVLLGLVLGEADISGAGFSQTGGAGASLLPLAAMLRLVALAPPGASDSASGSRDEIGILLEIVGGVASIAFLAQLPSDSPVSNLVVQLGSAALATYAAWMWLRAPDAASGRPYWIMAAGALAVSATARGSPSGSAAWGTLMLLAGAALFLRVFSERLASRLSVAWIWVGSALPFSLTATTWIGGGGWQDVLLPVLVLAQSMMLSGFVQSTSAPYDPAGQRVVTPSLRTIHRMGTALPFFLGLLLGFWGWDGALQIGRPVASISAVVSAIALIWAKRRFAFLNPVADWWQPPSTRRAFLTLRNEFGALGDALRRRAAGIARAMEGESGILWSLVILALLVSLIMDRVR